MICFITCIEFHLTQPLNRSYLSYLSLLKGGYPPILILHFIKTDKFFKEIFKLTMVSN